MSKKSKKPKIYMKEMDVTYSPTKKRTKTAELIISNLRLP